MGLHSRDCWLQCRFDLPAFWQEARRILKPLGAVAAWGYDIPNFPDHPACSKAMDEWYHGETHSYWSDRRRLVDNHYRGWKCCQADDARP